MGRLLRLGTVLGRFISFCPPFLLPLLHLLPHSISFHMLLIVSQTFCIVP